MHRNFGKGLLLIWLEIGLHLIFLGAIGDRDVKHQQHYPFSPLEMGFSYTPPQRNLDLQIYVFKFQYSIVLCIGGETL